MVLEEVFHKTKGEDGKPVVVKVRLPQIDVRLALKRFPHLYATSATGFGKEPKREAIIVNPAAVVGPTGGKPSMGGGVGVVEIVGAPGAGGEAPAA